MAMDDFRKQLKDLTADIHLSADEKDRMRERLEAYRSYRPIRRETAARTAAYSVFSTAHLRFVAPALAVALVFVSGGVSYAAERAIPGNVLYPIKVHVNEEVRSALTFDEETQLSWDIRRAERRLEEAAALVAEGKTDAETHAALRTKFEKHTEAVAEHVEAVEEENPTLALEAHSEFEASLMAHSEVIERLADREGGREAAVDELLTSVDAVALSLSGTVAAASDAALSEPLETMAFKAPETDAPPSSDEPGEGEASEDAARITALHEDGSTTPLTQEDATALRDEGPRDLAVDEASHEAIAKRMEQLVDEKLDRAATLLDRYRSEIEAQKAQEVEELLAEVGQRTDAAHELIEAQLYEQAFREYKSLLFVVFRIEVYIRTAGELNAPSIPLPTLGTSPWPMTEESTGTASSTPAMPHEEGTTTEVLPEGTESSAETGNIEEASSTSSEGSVGGSSSVDVELATSTDSGSAKVRVQVQIDTAL